MRVEYTDAERYVVVLRRAFTLLTFQAPEYEMDAERGVVRWRIDKGVLVARRARQGDGYLEIDLRRLPCDVPGKARMHVEVEIANFYPSIASRFGHLALRGDAVAHPRHRDLRRSCAGWPSLDLAESRVGRFATQDEVPDPRPVALRAARLERDRRCPVGLSRAP